jgi:predicted pyridoxine 5'-phosphate oxidase superfamily flavin-nucleotide-binding protein
MTEESPAEREDLPGSDGEHALQERFGTAARALAFYEDDLHERLTDRMAEFVGERIMFFPATADAEGHTDCSPRIGPAGFVNVLDADSLAYPEYRGNGVNASLGNVRENPHATFLFVDWWDTTVGLHVNGRASLHDSLSGATDPTGADRTKTWVVLEVEEAYVHCAKHVPQLSVEAFDPPWGTDDADAKQAGFFAEN